VSFEAAASDAFSGTDYDLAATFDSLHDMGDRLAAARYVRARVETELNPHVPDLRFCRRRAWVT
jgi:hypothetical protein